MCNHYSTIMAYPYHCRDTITVGTITEGTIMDGIILDGSITDGTITDGTTLLQRNERDVATVGIDQIYLTH